MAPYSTQTHTQCAVQAIKDFEENEREMELLPFQDKSIVLWPRVAAAATSLNFIVPLLAELIHLLHSHLSNSMNANTNNEADNLYGSKVVLVHGLHAEN